MPMPTCDKCGGCYTDEALKQHRHQSDNNPDDAFCKPDAAWKAAKACSSEVVASISSLPYNRAPIIARHMRKLLASRSCKTV
jgi:hypothetical protein